MWSTPHSAPELWAQNFGKHNDLKMVPPSFYFTVNHALSNWHILILAQNSTRQRVKTISVLVYFFWSANFFNIDITRIAREESDLSTWMLTANEKVEEELRVRILTFFPVFSVLRYWKCLQKIFQDYRDRVWDMAVHNWDYIQRSKALWIFSFCVRIDFWTVYAENCSSNSNILSSIPRFGR